MPDDRATQIRARLAAATPGPWKTNDGPGIFNSLSQTVAQTFRHTTREQDADLIANAPSDLAWLLAERAELLRRVEQYSDVRAEMRKWGPDGKSWFDLTAENASLLRRVEAAERAGAVKALPEPGEHYVIANGQRYDVPTEGADL